MKLVKITPLLLAMATFSAYAENGNDYPTLERVNSVLICMKGHGGQTLENLHACSCKIDVVASKIPFDIWEEAQTYKAAKRLPGEKGGLFRDSERADDIVPKLDAANTEAEKRCFISVRHIRAKADK